MATSPIRVTAFPETLRAFDAHMVVRGLSERTRHKYRYELMCFVVDWCYLRQITPAEAAEVDVVGYVASLPAQGRKRGDAIRALKAFYGWAQGRHRADDPAGVLRVPREKYTVAPELGEDEIRALLSAAFARERRRGWAIMLALATGARVSSLVAVRAEDLHLGAAEGPWLWFREAKGSHPYALALNRRGVVAARHLIACGHDPVLGVGAARFRQWIHAAEQDAGLERVWPHLLRHTFASRVARTGDIEAWRRAMNHADLSQWPRYVRASDRRVRSAVERA